MIATSVKFRGQNCFKSGWTGFDEVQSINIVIGRNNTGKSRLIDMVEVLCGTNFYLKPWEYQCEGILDEASLEKEFQKGASGGDLGSPHWDSHGKFFKDVKIRWTTDADGNVNGIHYPESFKNQASDPLVKAARQLRLKNVVRRSKHFLTGRIFRRLLADRDIQSEPANRQVFLAADGSGATNLIRRYLLSSSSSFPRELVQSELLTALNVIFSGDADFNEIQVKVHDEPKNDEPADAVELWEVFLGEQKKGLIRLSRSGSGLKTVILALLNLLVIPKLEKKQKSEYVFAFEELENNLHPRVLRRLLRYLEEYALRESATVFLTTHSSVALDVFSVSSNVQIVLLTHDGASATSRKVTAHFDHLEILGELGAKPSDLLQANGIVWVEGPSDRIYLNRWIDIFSAGTLKEGRDYQCAFFGGALLARTQFVPPESETELVNLLRVNANIVVVCDGDRTAATGDGSRVKRRVERIKAEVNQIPGAHIWITAAKEIENYLPATVLAKLFTIESVPDPGKYEFFFPSSEAGKKGTSFVESCLNASRIDKMELALRSRPHLNREALESRFDLAEHMKIIVEKIRAWNS